MELAPILIFSSYYHVGQRTTNFDGKIYILVTAVENLQTKKDMFSKTDILSDSKAAIQAVSLPKCPTDHLEHYKRMLHNHLSTTYPREITSSMDSFLPSHFTIMDKETADMLV